MPIYTYQIINDDGSPGETFDVIHGMNDPPLSVDPKSGKKVQRVFQPPHIAGWAESHQARQLASDENAARHGFTKYVRSGKGHYEKRCGEGPNEIHAQ